MTSFRLADVDEADLGACVEVLGDLLGVRKDTRQRLHTHLAAAAAQPPGVFRMADLEATAGAARNARNLSYLLDKASLDHAALRGALVHGAPLPLVKAFVVECATLPRDEARSWDVFGIVAVGENHRTPLNWRRIDVPPDDPPSEEALVDFSQAEVGAVQDLLLQLGLDYAAVEGPSGFAPPPLVAYDYRLGENPEARAVIRSTIPEYFLPVRGELTECVLEGEPYEQVRSEVAVVLQDYFPPWPEGSPGPEPRRVLGDAGAHGDEYVVAYMEHEAVRFAITRPAVSAARGELLGRRPHRRARELLEIAAGLPAPTAATDLRLTEFHHLSASGWERHALIVSAFEAVSCGQLDPSLARTRTVR